MAYHDFSASDAAHAAGPGVATERAVRAEVTPVLNVRNVARHFGHVTALADVSLEVRPGEVLALLGDNGAGKSTFISLLSGVFPPSSGEIFLEGQPVHFASPHEARTAGIATVFQGLALIEDRSIAENLFLGCEPTRFGFLLDRPRMVREASRLLEQLKVNLPPVTTSVRYLSGGQRQAVAVARTVLTGSKVVIMDEPTAALGVRETARVLDLIRRLRDDGTAVILISHNMDDVFKVADRAAVLRLGRKVADVAIAEVTREQVVGLVMGAGESGLEEVSA